MINANGYKPLLVWGVSKLFINVKPNVINDLTKFKNPPSWPVIFLEVPFNRIPLFSKNLIIFISLISLFVRVISQPLPA